MEDKSKSVFNVLNAIDVSERIKEKNGFKYVSWSTAWGEVKKLYPNATYKIIPQIMDDRGNTRFWHDDGKSGWVETSVTIDGETQTETLAIMDFRNKAIPADAITSVEANKSVKRCLVKACALHGLGLYVYDGEDLPEDVAKLLELQKAVTTLATKKSTISDKCKEKAVELCKAAEKEANPDMNEDSITGKVSNINDVAVLETLKKNLLAIRK